MDLLDMNYNIQFEENGILYSSVTQYIWSKQSNDFLYLSRIFETDDPDEISEIGRCYLKRSPKSAQDGEKLKGEKDIFKKTRLYYWIWANYLKFYQNQSRFQKLDWNFAPDNLKKIWYVVQNGTPSDLPQMFEDTKS